MDFLINYTKETEDIDDYLLTEDELDEIKKNFEIEGEKSAELRNIGPGADVMVVLMTILTIGNVFALGDKINTGIEGWLKLGKRIKKLIKKDVIVAVDKDGADLLAINLIATLENIQSLEKIGSHEVPLIQLEDKIVDGRKPEDLVSRPYTYYVQTFKVNDEKTYIIGIKSTGIAEVIKCFDYNPYGITEI